MAVVPFLYRGPLSRGSFLSSYRVGCAQRPTVRRAVDYGASRLTHPTAPLVGRVERGETHRKTPLPHDGFRCAQPLLRFFFGPPTPADGAKLIIRRHGGGRCKPGLQDNSGQGVAGRRARPDPETWSRAVAPAARRSLGSAKEGCASAWAGAHFRPAASASAFRAFICDVLDTQPANARRWITLN